MAVRVCIRRIWHTTAETLSFGALTACTAINWRVVVDDGLMGVTEVVRGSDLLNSTPRQMYLYEQLGFAIPQFYHMPLLTAPDGRRLSKRDGDLDLGVLREKFGRPEPIVGMLAKAAGLRPTAQPVRFPFGRRFFVGQNPQTGYCVAGGDLTDDPSGFFVIFFVNFTIILHKTMFDGIIITENRKRKKP